MVLYNVILFFKNGITSSSTTLNLKEIKELDYSTVKNLALERKIASKLNTKRDQQFFLIFRIIVNR